MRVTVMTAQNVIVIDGKGMALDCTGLRSRQVAFIRWYGDRGEVEYAGGAKANMVFKKFDAFHPDGFTVKGLVDSARPFGQSWKS